MREVKNGDSAHLHQCCGRDDPGRGRAARAALASRYRLAAADRPWACLFGRNPLIANPSIPYVGLLLLAHACLPPVPYGSLAARRRTHSRNQWRMTESIYAVVWTLMAVGYTYSGFTKLASPSWQNGAALSYMIDNPLARGGWVSEVLMTLPAWLLQGATWGVLAVELSFAPLALQRRMRPWLWGTMLLMHIGLMVVVDFVDLSLGMIMLHLFTFDPAWVRSRTRLPKNFLLRFAAPGSLPAQANEGRADA